MERKKFISLIILGVVFWLIGATTVKLLGDYVFTAITPLKIGMMIAAFPMLYFTILLVSKIVKLNRSEILMALVVINFAATLLDGIALTWFRQIYHSVYEISHYGSAWILWAGGAGLLIGYLMTDNGIFLGLRKVIFSVILGTIFWFVAAMIIRFFGDSVFSENNFNSIPAFIILFPLSYIFVVITKKIADLKTSELLNSISIVTLTAMLLDGIALNWFRSLYSDKYEVSHYGAAFILFGVGVGLLLAYFLTDKDALIENK